MTQWWDGMHVFQQVLFVIACATTLFMIVQVILLAIGSGDNDSSFDSDTSVDDVDTINDSGAGFTMFGLRILSVRSIIAFFAVGSWLTYALFYIITWWALIPGIAAGVAAAFAIALFMRFISKMQEDGTLAVKNTIGKIGDVYLTIPAGRSGNGKINVYVQERYVELDAVTDSNEPIKTGAKVTVKETLNEGVVLVEPYTSAKAAAGAPTDSSVGEEK